MQSNDIEEHASDIGRADQQQVGPRGEADVQVPGRTSVHSHLIKEHVSPLVLTQRPAEPNARGMPPHQKHHTFAQGSVDIPKFVIHEADRFASSSAPCKNLCRQNAPAQLGLRGDDSRDAMPCCGSSRALRTDPSAAGGHPAIGRFDRGLLAQRQAHGLFHQLLERLYVALRRPHLELGIAGGSKLQ